MKKIRLILLLLLSTNVMLGQYCLPTYNSQCSSGDIINSFSINTINNLNSGCAGPGINNYTDYSASFSTQLVAGNTYTVQCKPGPTWGQSFVVWIDFNQDGDFDELDEYFDIGYAAGGDSVSNSFTLPITALSGTTRLRVLCQFGNTPPIQTGACNSYSFGETEDYEVIMIPPCNVPDKPTLSLSNDTVCYEGQVTLNITGNLNDSDYWGIYKDSCDGPIIDSTASSSIVLSPNDSTTVFYVKGAGSCSHPDSSSMTSVIIADSINTTIDISSFPILTANQAGAAYQWVDCDNGNAPIASGTSRSFLVTENGNYAVEVTVGSCTEISSCQNITDVGINESINNNISIFPNPTNGLFTIDLDNNVNEVSYKIMTIEGRVILTDETLDNQVQIDLTNESNGIYFVKVLENNNLTTLKIVKK